MANYQTLDEFLREPFGDTTSKNNQKVMDYERRYVQNEQKIILNAHTVVDDSYFFHVKIPSESKKSHGVYYDVVIRFFTTNKSSLASSSIRDYWIQFFSNSPGFIYTYAVLYKQHGYLIDFLYEKLDPRYFDKLPEATNKNMELSFDKSIYFACRFLSERKFRVLNKIGIALGKRLSPTEFFKEIKDFQTVKFEGEIQTLEAQSMRKLKKELGAEEKKPAKSAPSTRTAGHRAKILPVSKKKAGKSTTGLRRTIVKKGTKSTSTTKKS